MIDRFLGKTGWLSNYEKVDIEYDGYIYKSVEAAYQAQKFIGKTKKYTKRMRTIFTKLDSNEAKFLGSIIPLRDKWNEVRDNYMLDLLRIKFHKEPYKSYLLKTGKKELIEGNTWHDIHFGKCNCGKHKGDGENILGKLLMQVRSELREEQ